MRSASTHSPAVCPTRMRPRAWFSRPSSKPGATAPEPQRLIGALLVNGLFHAAKQRDSRRRRDWFLICDEFGEFATTDFANSLDQLRKFGVHLVLAHQRLRQLEREDADVLSAVMTNAKVKIVFGGLERPEAERMARELF